MFRFLILKGFRVITEKKEDNKVTCEATIKVEVNGKGRAHCF